MIKLLKKIMGLASLQSLAPSLNTLRRKTLLSVGVFFSLSMLVTAVWVDGYFRQQTLEQVVSWQSSVLGAIVANTDNRFDQAQRVIVALAREMSTHAENFVAPEESRHIVKRYADLLEVFDNGVVLISPDGLLLAEYPFTSKREEFDLSQRDYFLQCPEDEKAMISRPYISVNSGKPVVMVSAPVFDKAGKKVGVVGGSLSLTNPEIFFQNQNNGATQQRVGGYFYIMDAERTILYHPDSSRLMHQGVPRRVNLLLDAALESGFTGSGEVVNSHGDPPLSRFRWFYGIFMVVVLCCGLIMTHLVTRNITANLEGIVTQLQRFPELPRQERRLVTSSSDESTPIAAAFNQLLEEIEIEHEKIDVAKRLAEEANRAKDRFLANISHELRTPLHGIIGLTQLSLESGLTPQQRENLEGILASGKNLLGLLNDLLDTAKIAAGKMSLESCHFNLRHLIKDISRLHGILAGQKGLALGTAVDPAIPDRLKGDPKRLRQVLNNLLNNAIKFSHEGTVLLSSTLLERRGDLFIICFTVKDEGIGVPADKAGVIFDPFVQAEGETTRRYGGTGLGLTICRQLVDLMGGEISVTSEIGVGSTFNFCVPLFAAQVTSEAFAENRALSRETEDVVKSPAQTNFQPTVLIVEDVAINRRIAQKALEGEGYRVLCACDGIEAIEIWQRDTVDLILMDVQMPRMDGLQATRIIRDQERQEGRWTPIVALTAGSSMTALGVCIEAGMDDALVKPYDIGVLRSLLIKIFQQGGDRLPHLAASEGERPTVQVE